MQTRRREILPCNAAVRVLRQCSEHCNEQHVSASPRLLTTRLIVFIDQAAPALYPTRVCVVTGARLHIELSRCLTPLVG